MPSVEGITPQILWYTIIGLVGIGSVIVLGDKVLEVFRKKKERDELKKQPENTLADSISRKVLDNLEPRFGEIYKKLANDRVRLDEHALIISRHNGQL